MRGAAQVGRLHLSTTWLFAEQVRHRQGTASITVVDFEAYDPSTMAVPMSRSRFPSAVFPEVNCWRL